jgi:hypothetical protein
MPRPPRPSQKRYRGRIRHDVASALRHFQRLLFWDNFYLAKPVTYYPNQLFGVADRVAANIAVVQLQSFMTALGPIPSR